MQVAVMRPSNFLLILQRANFYTDKILSLRFNPFSFIVIDAAAARELIASYNQSHPFLLVNKYSRAEGAGRCGWLGKKRNLEKIATKLYVRLFVVDSSKVFRWINQSIGNEWKVNEFLYSRLCLQEVIEPVHKTISWYREVEWVKRGHEFPYLVQFGRHFIHNLFVLSIVGHSQQAMNNITLTSNWNPNSLAVPGRT